MASERKGMVLLILRSKESAWQRLHEAPREMEYHHLITTDYGAYPSPRSTESIAKMIPGGSAPATLCDVPKASIAGQWAVKVVPQQRPTHMCHRDGLREKGNGPLDLEVERVSMASPSRGSQRDGIPPPNYDRLRSLSISQVYRVFRENDTKGVRHQLRSATCQRLPSQANGHVPRICVTDMAAERKGMVLLILRHRESRHGIAFTRLPGRWSTGSFAKTIPRGFGTGYALRHAKGFRRRLRRAGTDGITSAALHIALLYRTEGESVDLAHQPLIGHQLRSATCQRLPSQANGQDGRREKGNGPLDLEASRESAWHRLHEAPREMVYWVFRENDTKGVQHRLRSATYQRLPSQATKGRHRWHNISCTAHRAFVPHGRRIRRPGAPTSDRTPATLCDVPKASVAGQWAVRVVPQQRPTHMCHRDGRREKGNGPLDLEASRESAWHRLHEAPREMVYWVFRENDTKGVRHRLRSATCQRLPSQATKGRHRWHNISCTANRAFVPHGRESVDLAHQPLIGHQLRSATCLKASVAGQWAVRVVPQQRPTHMCHRDGRREKGNGPLDLEVERVSMASPSRGSQRDGIPPPNYDRLRSLSISQVYRVFRENDTKGVRHQLRSATCQRLPSQANGQDGRREKGNGPLDLEASRESAWHRLHEAPREMVYWVFRENDTKGVRHRLRSATYQRLPSQATKGRHRWHNISCTAHRAFVPHGRRIRRPGAPTSDRTPATLCDVPKASVAGQWAVRVVPQQRPTHMCHRYGRREKGNGPLDLEASRESTGSFAKTIPRGFGTGYALRHAKGFRRRLRRAGTDGITSAALQIALLYRTEGESVDLAHQPLIGHQLRSATCLKASVAGQWAVRVVPQQRPTHMCHRDGLREKGNGPLDLEVERVSMASPSRGSQRDGIPPPNYDQLRSLSISQVYRVFRENDTKGVRHQLRSATCQRLPSQANGQDGRREKGNGPLDLEASRESAWHRLHEAPREMVYWVFRENDTKGVRHRLRSATYQRLPSQATKGRHRWHNISCTAHRAFVPHGRRIRRPGAPTSDRTPATLCDVPKASVAGQWAVRVVPQQRPTHMCHRYGRREKGNGPLDLEASRESTGSFAKTIPRGFGTGYALRHAKGFRRRLRRAGTDGITSAALQIALLYRTEGESVDLAHQPLIGHQLRSATCLKASVAGQWAVRVVPQQRPTHMCHRDGLREKGNGPLDLEVERVYWVFRENDTKGVRHRLRSATYQRLPSQATKGRHRWHNISCTAHRAFVPHGRRIRRPGAPTSDRTPATLCDVPKASVAGQWAVRVVPQQRPTHMCHRYGRREKGNGPLDLEASRESAWHRLHEAPREMVYWVFRENDTKGVRHRLRSATYQRLPSQATKGRHRWHNISCTAHRAFVPHGRRIRRPGAPTSDRTPATLCDVPKASVAGQWAVRVVPQQRPTHMCHRYGRREKGNGPLDLEASRESTGSFAKTIPRGFGTGYALRHAKGFRRRLRRAGTDGITSAALQIALLYRTEGESVDLAHQPLIGHQLRSATCLKASVAGQWAVRVVPQQRPTHMCHRDGLREKGNGPLDLEVERVSMASPSRGSQRDGIPPPNYDQLRSLSISQVYRVFRENDTKGVRHQLRSATCQRLPSQANGHVPRICVTEMAAERKGMVLLILRHRESRHGIAFTRLPGRWSTGSFAKTIPRGFGTGYALRHAKGFRRRLRRAGTDGITSAALQIALLYRTEGESVDLAHQPLIGHQLRSATCLKASVAGQWAVRVVPQQRPTHMCHRGGRQEKRNGPLDLEASEESAWHRLL
ncbi:hypothetical protein F5148DRAFT_1320129 [Russula earlei]|uniref:Uncharacterized protein n=1 Tax=Russula earlei TaxID=71964 RepID=A0ACC0U3Y9_9AGAM|nr:hypothetical protein F5148DRAFT_1320129 [Russula earlei]